MLSVAESHPEPEREERGDHLILIHCAAVGRERPSAHAPQRESLADEQLVAPTQPFTGVQLAH